MTDGTLRNKALGADGLRLWVALHGAEGNQPSRIGPVILEDIDLQVGNGLFFLSEIWHIKKHSSFI